MALDIEFDIGNLPALLKSMEQAARVTAMVAQAYDAQGRAVQRATGPYSNLIAKAKALQAAQSGGGAGPYSSLIAKAKALQAAQSGGGAVSILDAQHNFSQAQKRVEKLQAGNQSSIGAAVKAAINSSRVGGEGLLPLVSKLGGVAEAVTGIAGLGEIAGPVGVAISAAVQLGKAFYELEKSVSENVNQFAALQSSMGSFTGAAGQTASIGASVGLSPGQISGLSERIQNKITSDPYAQAYASGMGVSSLPRPFSGDEGANLVKIANELAKITDPMARRRAAQALSAEELLPYANQSQGQRDKLGRDATLKTSIFDADFIQKSADFTASLGRLGEAFSNLLAAVGKPGMQLLTNVFNEIADNLNTLATVVNSPLVQTMLANMAKVSALGGALAMSTGTGYGAGMDAHTQALKENTAATRENTLKFGDIPGQFGHSDRLQGAIPDAFGYGNGFALRQSRAMGEGMKLGAVPI